MCMCMFMFVCVCFFLCFCMFICTWRVIRPHVPVSYSEAVLRVRVPDEPLGVFRSVGKRRRSEEGFEVIQSHRQTPVWTPVLPVVVHLWIGKIDRPGTAVVVKDCMVYAETVCRSSVVDASRVVTLVTDQRREGVARTRTGVHGRDRHPGLRVVVLHDSGSPIRRTVKNLIASYK